MKGVWILFLILGIFLLGCTESEKGNAPDRPKGEMVAKVGDRKIPKRYADYRDEVIQVYYPQEDRSLGLNQLIQAYRKAEILEKHDHPVDRETLKEEAKRIEKETRMPSKLKKIQSIFGDDQKAYRRVYVLPTYVDRVLYYEFFLNNKSIHEESLNQAGRFIQKVQKADNPEKKYKELIKKQNLNKNQATLSLKRGLEWKMNDPEAEKEKGPQIQKPKSKQEVKFEKRQKKQASKMGKRWINHIIENLSPGEIHDEVINHNRKWMVFKYLKPIDQDQDIYRIEAVFFPKREFGPWLKKQKQTIPVQRFD